MLGQLSAQDQVTRLSGSESILCFSSRLPDFVPYKIRSVILLALNVLLFALSSKPGGYNTKISGGFFRFLANLSPALSLERRMSRGDLKTMKDLDAIE